MEPIRLLVEGVPCVANSGEGRQGIGAHRVGKVLGTAGVPGGVHSLDSGRGCAHRWLPVVEGEPRGAAREKGSDSFVASMEDDRTVAERGGRRRQRYRCSTE
jgi:hypothetical protein